MIFKCEIWINFQFDDKFYLNSFNNVNLLCGSKCKLAWYWIRLGVGSILILNQLVVDNVWAHMIRWKRSWTSEMQCSFFFFCFFLAHLGIFLLEFYFSSKKQKKGLIFNCIIIFLCILDKVCGWLLVSCWQGWQHGLPFVQHFSCQVSRTWTRVEIQWIGRWVIKINPKI